MHNAIFAGKAAQGAKRVMRSAKHAARNAFRVARARAVWYHEHERMEGGVRVLKEYIEGYGSLSIIGMCKNAGKTTVLNRIIEELRESGRRLALTSIGRDGESVDVVTRTAKPGIYVYEGTLIATAEDMFRLCDITKEILFATGWPTPLGEVAVVRALSDGAVQLAGPSMTVQLSGLVKLFASFGADITVIDGAISRKTLCAPAVSEATVLCTGASYSRDINEVVEDTAFAAALLTLPRQTLWSEEELLEERAPKVRLMLEDGQKTPLPAGMTLGEALRSPAFARARGAFISGAVTEAMLQPVLQSSAALDGFELAALDGSKLLFPRHVLEKLRLRGVSLRVANPVHVAAVTINPVSAYGFDMDAGALLSRMRERVNVPVVNVMRAGE